MAYGFAGGLAEGLQSGLALGQNAKEIETKRQLLLQEQIQEKVKVNEGYINAAIKQMSDIITNSAGGMKDPKVAEAVGQIKDHVNTNISQLASLGEYGQSAAQRASQALTITLSHTKGKTEQMLEETQGKMQMASTLADQLYPQKPGAPQSPMLPPAAMPSPGPQIAQSVVPPVTPPTEAAKTELPWLQQQQPAPAAPPAAGLGSQVEAAPAPQVPAAPKNLKPIFSNDNGPLNVGDLPIQDIEALIANQDQKDLFETTYGVDSSPLFQEPQQPGGDPRAQLMRGVLGIEESAAEKALATQGAKDYSTNKKAYGDSIAIIQHNFQQRNLIDDGIISGFGADYQLPMKEFMAKVTGNEDPRIANTRAFLYEAQSKAAKLIKNFGAGTGLSDADLKFAMQLAAGDITMTEASLRKALDASTRAALWIVQNPSRAADPDLDGLKARARRLGLEDELEAIGLE